MITLTFTPDELNLLKEALDSHIYWQLSDEHYRHSGFVYDPGSDDAEHAAEIQACERLDQKLTLAPNGR
ncbi:MAG: hypothetical protein IT381_11500 [Deltaproteobacteria bacterium]|nr:hypothetical protein [Deltaproteobacteria bacterium]